VAKEREHVPDQYMKIGQALLWKLIFAKIVREDKMLLRRIEEHISFSALQEELRKIGSMSF
jgi:hypothetical protein